jgi:hypothetical protein
VIGELVGVALTVEVAEAEEALMRMDALKLRTVRGWTSTSTSQRSIT